MDPSWVQPNSSSSPWNWWFFPCFIWLADLAALRKGKAGHSSFKGSIFDLN